MDKKSYSTEIKNNSSDRLNRSNGSLSGKHYSTMSTQKQNADLVAYGEFFKRPEWFAKRDVILKRDKGMCLHCGSGNNLQVHHRQYHRFIKSGEKKMPWEYNDKYLVTLCMDCHQIGHKYFKVPVFNV